MHPQRSVFILMLMFAISVSALGDSLPLVQEGEFAPLKANSERLLQALEMLGATLPPGAQKSLRAQLNAGDKDEKALEKIQTLLDSFCLIGVNINPESRVKAARGPANAELSQNQWATMLIKVHNQAGVTQQLKVYSPQMMESANDADGDRWLQAEVYEKPPMTAKLSGHEVEYVILRLRSRDAGKREAKLVFDVGQGTQDLGFRAEVPILFTIKPGTGAAAK